MSRELVDKFLRDQELHADFIDMDRETELFIANMKSGLEQTQDQMKMIPTYIEVGSEIPTGETVIVLDAGGTNFRVAAVTFARNMEAIIEGFETYRMPGTDGEISKNDFYDAIVQYIRPLLSKSRKIGFCFSYPSLMFPNKDGQVLNFSKEVELPEVVGTIIGESIREALEREGLDSDVEVVILNDTVAALLGGMNQAGGRSFDSWIGFILGTGTNTAYAEDISRIVKLGEDRGTGRMIINMESGTYPIENRSSVDVAIDQTTNAPGSYLFEKMISGRYQGAQLWHTLVAAVKNDLFSPAFKAAFEQVGDIDSYNLDQFLYAPEGDNVLAGLCATEDDQLNLYYLIDNLFERAARLATVNLAGILVHLDAGRNPVRPAAITAEGTTFYKAKLLKPKIDYWMRVYTNDKLGHYHEFITAENPNLIGAAIAALTNL